MKDHPLVNQLTALAAITNRINPAFYHKYNLKRGLRNENGTGVMVGLTQVSSVVGYQLKEGVKYPAPGRLYYRGIEINELVEGFASKGMRGFEETVYLLIFGVLPTAGELEAFNELLDAMRRLPDNFTENMILKIPSRDVMNKLQRSVLVLYSQDPDPDDLSVKNLLIQSLYLIARFPTIIAYGYQAKAHYFDNLSLHIHSPQAGIGTAGNILHMIRPDNRYSRTEAEVLDLCLVLHADHGGGNNSSFATHVVSSSGTDTYSAIAAAVGCLKGPKHGGANIKVSQMVADIKAHCDPRDLGALKAYLKKILEGGAFDGKGLIYGMGHAVYTMSDVRALILKDKARKLAREKGCLEEFELYAAIEALTQEIFFEVKGPKALIPANVDLYSGLVYQMLGIPQDLFTPIFAVARVAGWCAHRMEQLLSDEKILRPAYQSVAVKKIYSDIGLR